MIKIYKIVGYSAVAFILNFIILYYIFTSRNVKNVLKKYYKYIGVEFSLKAYFLHIRSFAFSILDRFISRIDSNEISFIVDGDEKEILSLFSDGTMLVLSHVGGWATAGHSLKGKLLSFRT